MEKENIIKIKPYEFALNTLNITNYRLNIDN